MFAFVFNGSM